MQKEIVLGGDLRPNYNAICLWERANISENGDFYVFMLDIANSNIFVFVVKSSTLGKSIKEWLSNEENRNDESVRKKAIQLLLPSLTPDDFIEILDKEKGLAFDNGYRTAQADFRRILDIYQ